MAKARPNFQQKYLILAVYGLDPDKREEMENQTKVIGTPTAAVNFVVTKNGQIWNHHLSHHEEQKRLAAIAKKKIEDLDVALIPQPWKFSWVEIQNARVGLLSYSGIELALFFKRQTTEYTTDSDSVVESTSGKVLKTKEEAWIRVSLTEAKSAMKQAQFFSSDFKQMEQDRDQYKRLTSSQTLLIEQQDQRILTLEKQIEELSKKKEKV